jgi:hypothetical protein
VTSNTKEFARVQGLKWEDWAASRCRAHEDETRFLLAVDFDRAAGQLRIGPEHAD